MLNVQSFQMTNMDHIKCTCFRWYKYAVPVFETNDSPPQKKIHSIFSVIFKSNQIEIVAKDQRNRLPFQCI